MKLSIVVADNAVTKDGKGHGDLDLSACNIPENVWALQWEDTSGHIEYNSALVQNDNITELPAWATACLLKWQEAEDAELNTPSINYSLETFWNDYPIANIKDVEWLISNSPEGLTVDKLYYQHSQASAKVVGIRANIVKPGPTGVSAVLKMLEMANEKGVPFLSDRNNFAQGFVEFLSNNGWAIYTEPSREEYTLGYREWTLDMAKAHKKRAINFQRDTNINNGYNDGTNVWDIDSQSMTNMTSKTVGLADNTSVTWRTKANTNVTMTGAEFKLLVADAVAAVDVIYQDSWTKKAAVDNATSIADVNAV
jgi:hypothetical protein